MPAGLPVGRTPTKAIAREGVAYAWASRVAELAGMYPCRGLVEGQPMLVSLAVGADGVLAGGRAIIITYIFISLFFTGRTM